MWRIYSRNWPIRTALLSLCGLALALAHAAAQEPSVGVSLAARKLVATDKGESLVPADTAKPGDVIEYQATYKNRGQSPVLNVAATVPIPAGLALVAESSRPIAQQASLDGKTFAPIPLMKEVKTPAGITEKQPIPLGEYRALRWVLPELAAGADAKVALRARVLTNSRSH